jgi:hypothetical protein
MDAEPKRESADDRSPRQRWDPSYAAVAITLIGGTVYTFFRLAYASFYATFHTTPEEVGLNYSQTIVRGVIPSVAIAAVVLFTAILVVGTSIGSIGYIIILRNLTRLDAVERSYADQLRAQTRNDPQDADSLDRYREKSRALWLYTQQHYPGTARIIARTYGWSDEDVISDMADSLAASFTNRPLKISSPKYRLYRLLKLMNALIAEVWHISWRTVRHKAMSLTLLVAVLVGLAFLISHEADRVREGHALGPSLSILTGLRAEKVTVTAIETGKQLPTGLTTGPVIYLGESNGTAIILISEGEGTTVRVPLSQIVIQSPLQ